MVVHMLMVVNDEMEIWVSSRVFVLVIIVVVVAVVVVVLVASLAYSPNNLP